MRNYNPLIRVNEKIDAAPANVWDVITHVEWSPASAARSYMLQAIPVKRYSLFLQSRCGYRSGDCRNACFRPQKRPVTQQLNLLDSRRSDAEACIRRRKLPLIPSIF
jgi:hypothetical protein